MWPRDWLWVYIQKPGLLVYPSSTLRIWTTHAYSRCVTAQSECTAIDASLILDQFYWITIAVTYGLYSYFSCWSGLLAYLVRVGLR